MAGRPYTSLSRVLVPAVVALALSLFSFAPSALAGPPNHTPKPDPIGGFTLNHACGAAADSEGNRYVSNAGNDKIEVFDPTGAHLRSIANANEPCGLAVDSHGTLFATEKGTGKVIRYVPDHYPFVGVPTYDAREEIDASGEAQGIAVDTTEILTLSNFLTGGDDTLFIAKGDHVDAHRNEKQDVNVSCSGGTYTLEFEGQKTPALNCGATHQQVQEALEDLSTIGAGNVHVTTGNFRPTDHLIIYIGNLGLANQPKLIVDSSLPDSVSQSEVNGGQLAPPLEDPTADYTGIAAYTHQIDGNNFTRYLYAADASDDTVEVFSGPSLQSLKARRTISGVDEDASSEVSAAEEFEFGPEGAYLAVDPGNGNPGLIEAGEATKKCISVAEQACTAGHLLVYDAGHEALDEFDATGEFLDQPASDEFADAEPTGLAIERSGGPNDGTIYVTAGKGTGAKLLAFSPLVTPSRTPVPKLSQVLTSARAVAVDEYGDVYVAAGPSIKVFGPDGSALTTIEDARKPYDLAVDSQCNVYVLDGGQENEQLTYYEPPACPPGPGSSFGRHEPPIVPSTLGLRGVAVNPVDDHVFLLKANSATEFEGPPVSTQVRTCNAGFGNGFDIAFYGGEEVGSRRLYVAASDGRIYKIDCGPSQGKEEILAETGPVISVGLGGGGCPAGVFGTRPRIAVDQSNGHMLQFEPSVAGGHAREYDGALSCVAEYGAFAEGVGTPAVSIAVDNGKHSPNRGIAYIAFDGNDNLLQPYDLTAFTPLSYGEAPKALTGVANGIGPSAATLRGTVDPSGFLLEECRFEYLAEAAYEHNIEESDPPFQGATSKACAEDLGDIGAATAATPVHADLSSLSPSPQTNAYRFRLIATNKFGESAGDPWSFGPPEITPKPALPVFYAEATLRAEVDPSGLETTYRFDYGTKEGEYEQSTPPVTLEPHDGKLAIEAPLTGLAEGAEYHFQLIAENEAATAKGPEAPDQSFTTLQRLHSANCSNTEYRVGLSANLPECRAYELITPADSGNAEPGAVSPANPEAIFNNWSVDPRGPGAGESVAFLGFLPGFEGEGSRATRSPGAHPAQGWQTHLYSFTYAQRGGGGGAREGVSADQRYWLWNMEQAKFPALLPFGHYLRVPDGTASPDCNIAPNNDPETFQDEFELVGCGSLGVDPDAVSRFVSAGGEHVVFFSDKQLESDASPNGTQSIYDRKAGKAEAEVISVEPDGDPFGVDATYVGASEDGSTVLFEVGGILYAHRGGQSTAIGPYAFAGVSEDGSRVHYTSAALSSELEPGSLYACDLDAGPCSATPFAEEAAFVNVSPGGTGVLFSSEEAIPGTEPNENGKQATDNVANLYSFDGATIRFVAILDTADFKGFGAEQVPGSGTEVDLGAWVASINASPSLGRAKSPTRATPDGGVFVFQSHAKLTAYDNGGKGEIYRYEPTAPAGKRLICVSCDPTGAPPSADAMLQIFAGAAGGSALETTLITNVTDDGQAVIFQSPDRLLPEDASEAVDVYEWKAQGTGEGPEECKRPAGCLALISSGQGEDQASLLGMSADGSDILFTTREELVGQDIPGSYSIYDARVEGGIPDSPAKAPCQGDACQGKGSTPPVLPSPGSTSRLPGGDVSSPVAQRCPKGKRKVIRKGKARCVKPHKKKRHHKRRAHRSRRASR